MSSINNLLGGAPKNPTNPEEDSLFGGYSEGDNYDPSVGMSSSLLAEMSPPQLPGDFALLNTLNKLTSGFRVVPKSTQAAPVSVPTKYASSFADDEVSPPLTRKSAQATSFNSLALPPRTHSGSSQTNPKGLENLGNSCWFNAVFQTFFRPENSVYHQALVEKCSGELNSDNANAKELLSLVDQMPPTREMLSSFMSRFSKEPSFEFDNFSQQDAGEMLLKIVNFAGLESTPSFTNSRFKICSKLVHVEETQPDVVASQGSSFFVSLHSMNPTSVQELVDENIGLSSGSDVDYKNQKWTQYHYFTNEGSEGARTIVFQLPRFKGDGQKNTTSIVLNPKIQIPLFDQTRDSVVRVASFTLKGVVLHLGKELHSGHYTSYLIRETGCTWFNDTVVREFASMPSNVCKNDGYIVHYEYSQPHL